MTTSKLITKRDLRKVFFRSFPMEWTWNYEKQQNLGYTYALIPIIEKLYKDKPEEKAAALQRHLEFFNATPHMVTLILGISTAMEEENALDENFDTSSINSVKAGKPHNTTGEIHNTNDGPLYQTMRTGLDSYCFDVPEGIYEVEMLFSDVFSPKDKIIYLLGRNTDELLSSQGNSFSIQIDGNMVEKVFNPGVEAGSYQAVKRRYIVNHKEGTLKVVFKATQGKAHLSAIKLRKL